MTDERENVDPEKLAVEIEELKRAINQLNNQKFFKMHSSWMRFIGTSIVRGLFVGLGSVIGATVLLYFFLQFLSNIDFIPIVGEWAVRITEIINNDPPSSP